MRLKLLPIIFCLFSFSIFGQEKEVQKIDEFGNGINCESYLAQTDAMIQTQANNPDSRIYIFVYEGKERKDIYKNGKFVDYKLVYPQYGLAEAKIESMKKYLTIRKIPLENYVFVKSGFREDFWVEVWLVPNGAEPPKPTPTLEKMKYRKGKAKGFCLGCCG